MSPARKDLTGRSLGHYKSFERIGTGGMGVVYRALDTRLDRSVAIKVLPSDSVEDHDRRRRFIQEAKAASALNHPSIVTIYEIGVIDETSFIAMEYVAGRRLDELIGAKGLPLDEALHYAIQITDALGAAHAAGIIHRDVKPGNIMVTDKGLVKVLDFGLAKLAEPEVVGDQTVSLYASPLTAKGTIVGTFTYMSPEQAEGKKLDTRSDIFSFGAVLYEMVTGRQAFAGNNPISTLVAVAGKEPTPIREMISDPPAGLEDVIASCLRKDPAQRPQTMEDVKHALEALRRESFIWPASGVRERLGSTVRMPQPRGTRRWWLLAGGLAIAVVLAGVFWFQKRGTPQAPWNPIVTRLTADMGLSAYPALSPDGKLLAYASDRSGKDNLDIWVQQVSGGDPVRVTTDPADEYEPAFSPDGSHIAYRSDRAGGGVWMAPALGGAPRLIAERGRRPLFSPDGKQLLYWVGSGAGQMFVADLASGQPRAILPEFESARFPVWSPDGKNILFLGIKDAKGLDPTALSGESLGWWVVPAAGGPAKKTTALEVLRRAGMSAPSGERLIAPDLWTADGEVIFSARLGGTTNVWRIGISPKSLEVIGEPQRLTGGTLLEAQGRLVQLADGTLRLVFASLARGVDVWGLPADADRMKIAGERQRLTRDTGNALAPAISRDGKRLVYISTRSGNADVYLKNLVTNMETAIATGASDKAEPSISPDGSTVSYVDVLSTKEAGVFLVTIGPDDHPLLTKMLCKPCAGRLSWTSDGRKALVGRFPPARPVVVDIASGDQTEFLRHPTYNIWQTSFSPDDHWVSFNMPRSPIRSNIYIARVPEKLTAIPVDQWITVTSGDTWDDKPRWAPDGNGLYFISQRDGFRCIWYQRLDPENKQPMGDPAPLYHLHSRRLSMASLENPAIEIGVAADKLVFALGELTGNVWMARSQSPQRISLDRHFLAGF